MNDSKDHIIWVAACILVASMVFSAFGFETFKVASEGLCKETAIKKGFAASEVIAVCTEQEKKGE